MIAQHTLALAALQPARAALQDDEGAGPFQIIALIVLGIGLLVFFVIFMRYANLYIRSLLTRAGVGLGTICYAAPEQILSGQ